MMFLTFMAELLKNAPAFARINSGAGAARQRARRDAFSFVFANPEPPADNSAMGDRSRVCEILSTDAARGDPESHEFKQK
jgi:hypothetical protein